MLHVTINAEPHQLPHAMSVMQLLEHLALDTRKVAVERNLEIVPRSLHAQVMLAEGDRIEIVTFMGGG